MTSRPTQVRGVAALRRLTAPRPAQETCELCAKAVPEQHQHLVDPESRRLLCACDACAILFDYAGVTRYRRVPRDSRAIADNGIGDTLWNSLGIPVGLAFFFRSSVSNTVLAVYPSPAGPTEVPVTEQFPAFDLLTPDVEALLINRTRGARDCYIVPIDQCYRLIGTIRQNWSGFSGGDDLWGRIDVFFDDLKQGSYPEKSPHA